MATSKTQAEWLSLVEVSGPFLTLPVLTRAFPAGLEPTDRELVEELRVAYAEVTDDPTLSPRWVRWVLERLLDLPDTVLRHGAAVPGRLTHRVGEHRIELRPDYAVIDPGGETAEPKARLLVTEWPWATPLDERPPDSTWAASPIDRMEELCRDSGLRLGLVTNGETWTLVDALASGPRGTATWDAELWLEERSTLDAFTTLLGARRFFTVSDAETLEALLAESADAEAEVTDQLGRQVRQAVEVLIDAWSRVNRERRGQLFGPLTHAEIYQGAVTVLMRLVFLLCAEERGLFLLGDPLYDSAYAISTLRAQLAEEADTYGEDVLERHSGAWHRLLATFRMVHAGAHHENLSLPAYGGSLFDPDRFGWLEGRHPDDPPDANRTAPVPVDDRTVLHILDALQVLRFRRRGESDEARHLSFRALDVEQIGHVYEGLLDHGAVPVDDVVLGLTGKKEPELLLDEVESRAAQGRETLTSWLVEQTGLSAKAVTKALDQTATPEDTTRLASACDNDPALAGRIVPYLGLVRRDLRGLPQVWLPGSVVMTQAGDRRSSGTYYTPKALAEEMVRHALEPLVHHPGPADGASPEGRKLRPAAELLDLRVCDMAMGSGAFLVAACRYLAARLLEAWSAEGVSVGDPVGPPGGTPVPLPGDETDREVLALRLVADRCLYGVDRNPMAVEMAKLSLWLVTLAKGRPFSFIDHALRTGDSLLGVTSLEQIEYLHLDPAKGAQLHGGTLFDPTTVIRPLVDDAVRKRREIESFLVLDVADAETKCHLFDQARSELEQLAVIANVVVGASLSTATQSDNELENRLLAVAPDVRAALDLDWSPDDRSARIEDLRLRAEYWLDEGRPPMAPDRVCFHWPLEFPEVFIGRERPGFDAVVGNPPFLGGAKISGVLGGTYFSYLAKAMAHRKTNRADLVVFFFLRASRVSRRGGTIGLLATNTIAQGDSREAGLDFLTSTSRGWNVVRAVKSWPWPGDASLQIAQIWLYFGSWSGRYILENRSVEMITSALEPAGRVVGPPLRLKSVEDCSFHGSKLNTEGFVLSPAEAGTLLDVDARNTDVVMPYMNGDDLNSRPDCTASRYVINFRDWPLDMCEQYPGPLSLVRERVMPEVLRKVQEAREKKSNSYVGWERRWWQFWNVRADLHRSIAGLDRVLVISRVSKHLNFAFVSSSQVLNERLVILAYNEYHHFGLLTSEIHISWALTNSTTHETRPTYFPTDCFDTFPQPSLTEPIGDAGAALEGFRRQLMLDRWEGLTSTYNRVHNPKEEASDIAELRRLHVELDHAVAAAYGWEDLRLDHGFWETRQGMRFTVSAEARVELLDRLLELNHERYAEEVRLGLHDKKAKRGPAKRARSASAAPALFEVEP